MTTVDIVGGGLAGLAVAASLDSQRFHVRLHEHNPGSRRWGTVLGMWPSGMKALDHLGIGDQVRAASVKADGASIFTCTGRRLIFTIPPGDSWLIPRPDLLELLDAAVPDTVERIIERADPASLTGDVVIAADGVRSGVRQHAFGTEAIESGTMALRGLVDGPMERYSPHQRGLREYWGRRSLFGLSPNSHDDTHWYAAMPEFQTTPAEALEWARDHYRDFPAPVQAVLAAADPRDTIINRIVEAPLTRTLVKGRFVLIGDAAHAMSPNLGRNAAEAMVDAAVLAQELSRHAPAEALKRYERRRLLLGQAVRLASTGVRKVALRWP